MVRKAEKVKRGRHFMNLQGCYKKSEEGVALILAMLVILVLTVLAASIVFVTQSQVWTSYNYRLTTQCRYAAEGGVHATMNWLQNVYVPPAIPFPAAFDLSKYPVQCIGGTLGCSAVSAPVVLAGDGSFNYPDPLGTIAPAYKAALYQRPVNPIASLTYSTTATLMAMTPLQGAFPGVPANAIQIWQVTSVGNFAGAVRNAQVQLVVTYQKMLVSATANALYGTSTTCPALTLGGTTSFTDSYNSSLGSYPAGVQTTGGNVGSNGGLTLNGGATVNGNFSFSPTDPCASAPYAGAGLNGSNIAMPMQPPYPTPPPPSPVPPTTTQKIDNKGCDTNLPLGSGCTDVVAGTDSKLAPVNPTSPALYGNLGFSNPGNTVELSAGLGGTPGIYNVNSLSLSSGVTLKIDSCPVILNVAGTGVPPSQPVLDTSSGAIANSFPPSCLQIVYGGTGLIKLAGGAAAAGVVYAPNASVTLTGGGSWNGAIIANNVTDTGGTQVHYDRALGSAFYIAGNYVPMGFNWSSF